ncbi:uncharacterized protein ARMOST_18208 [Armillaria ostoyae]|uniref:Uncharacterized protein n=1 Tax=Armillaria ostoyae TaxID=47428 RepID=A0A284S144_ARMOS|nr:uncharacterized protein ARMOST_18208 [Armillaria ostoyae]
MSANPPVKFNDIHEDETGAMTAERPTVIVTKFGNDVKPKQTLVTVLMRCVLERPQICRVMVQHPREGFDVESHARRSMLHSIPKI